MADEYIQPMQPIEEKKSHTWIWLIVLLVIVALGIGAYVLLSGDGTVASGGGSSGGIPQPPALPSE